MKKTVLFLFLSLVMIGCKDKEEVQSTDNSKTPSGNIAKLDAGDEEECLDLEEYNKLKFALQKADWLKKYGRAVCKDTLYKYSKKEHFLDPEGFGTTADDGNNKLTKRWEDIKVLTNSYSVYAKYISFKIDGTTKKITDLDIVSDFSNTIPCYSLALFRGIAKDNNDGNITFEFQNAEVRGKQTIIIRVIDLNGGISYFDYSDEPKKAGGKSPL